MRSALSIVIAIAVACLGACASNTPPPANPAPKKSAQKAAPAPKTEPPNATKPARADDAANDMPIGSLTPDAGKVVRVRGHIAAIKGMRLVPPSVIFTVRDSSGTVTAVIKEKQKPALREGVKVELIGTYQNTDSPTGAPGKENVLVVDRYLIMQ